MVSKIDWFRSHAGDDCLLLPHRVEFVRDPSDVDRFFIDGPMEELISALLFPTCPLPRQVLALYILSHQESSFGLFRVEW